jgi:hypothetical protein
MRTRAVCCTSAGGDPLHERVPQAASIWDDGQGVAAEAGGGEYIDHLIGDVGH